MIDWIIAQRIATFVAGTGDASEPTADLAALAAESEIRVVAYTGLEPTRPLPPPEGIGRREWVSTNIESMRLLLDPVLQRANDNLGPLKPAVEIGMGIVLSTEVGVVLGYLAQRVLGQYELVLLDEAVEDRPPRLLFVLPNLGHAVQAFGADEEQFMTWVALHEVTHAVQFAGVPWLHASRRRPGSRAAEERRGALGDPAQAAGPEHRRGQARARPPAQRRPDLDRDHHARSARRSTACRR